MDQGSRPLNRATALEIVVCDSHVDGATVLCDMLAIQGFSPRCAFTAGRALELVEQFKPNVLICEPFMHDMDGRALALRARDIRPGIALIALTGWARASIEYDSLMSVFDHAFLKPVEPDNLFQALMLSRPAGTA